MKIISTVRTELAKSGLTAEQIEMALPSTLALSAVYRLSGLRAAQMFASILVTFNVFKQEDMEGIAAEIEKMPMTTGWDIDQIEQFVVRLGLLPTVVDMMTFPQVAGFARMAGGCGPDNAAAALRFAIRSIATEGGHR